MTGRRDSVDGDILSYTNLVEASSNPIVCSELFKDLWTRFQPSFIIQGMAPESIQGV